MAQIKHLKTLKIYKQTLREIVAKNSISEIS